MSWSSSVSIVSDYRLDERGSIPCGSKGFFFSSLFVQTSSEARPASCPVGTGGPLQQVKARPGRDPDHSPHLVSRSRINRSLTSTPSVLAPPFR
jgi:hypothetical protein